MRAIRLHPVREDERDNYRDLRERRKQSIGSVLHWAADAGATHVLFDPTEPEPFVYLRYDGESLTTEAGPTPADAVPWISGILRELVEGTGVVGFARRQFRRATNRCGRARIEIPSSGNHCGSTWLVDMDADRIRFIREDKSPCEETR